MFSGSWYLSIFRSNLYQAEIWFGGFLRNPLRKYCDPEYEIFGAGDHLIPEFSLGEPLLV